MAPPWLPEDRCSYLLDTHIFQPCNRIVEGYSHPPNCALLCVFSGFRRLVEIFDTVQEFSFIFIPIFTRRAWIPPILEISSDLSDYITAFGLEEDFAVLVVSTMDEISAEQVCPGLSHFPIRSWKSSDFRRHPHPRPQDSSVL